MSRISWRVIAVVMGILALAGCGQSPQPPPSPPPTATSNDPVHIRTNATSYQVGDTITVMLSNQSSQTIYFLNHQTNCTVVSVQLQTDSGWTPLNNCAAGGISSWQTLKAGESLTVMLKTSSDSRWTAGIYRAVLNYHPSSQTGPMKVTFSATFQLT